MCSRSALCLYILPVIVLTSTWNIPRFMELQPCYKLNKTVVTFCQIENNNSCLLSVCPTELRLDFRYCRDYILIGNFLIMVLLPLVLLSGLNSHIYRVLAHSSKRISTRSDESRARRDNKIAAILITIVIIFICCNIPRVSINMFEVRNALFFSAHTGTGVIILN